ncbi:phosphatase PAP2 family protein [Natronocalculus amylovorans]|uniref:Phosphatase PAP2 family protein n=1 Tax=Natronocalculus amylovorans TaxID=2917812 RepID=A0AAE3FVW4_9EURY|nr:phosphatase PAP2 family protein [Natronocalculus amylovorans]MCL9815614.1 phosphatase PAP2 family protein [Natronocalculus amylovorans]
MALLRVIFDIAVVVIVLCLIGSVTLIGPVRLRELQVELRDRAREAAPAVGILLCVLILNALVRDATQELSWLIGWNITPLIRDIEGGFVIFIQSFATPFLTAYFSYIYVFGYVFLLVFPFIAYAALSDQDHLKSLLIAYTLNYGLGLICYIIFIAYGPRNSFDSGEVESLLYTVYPQFQFLTSTVNVNTNVFPSLHTSLSVTAALLAFHSRREYPIWFWLSIILATSVVISTMYLGIHWFLDVIAGTILAVVSVELGRRYVKYGSFRDSSSESQLSWPWS